jgi:O-antigen ligase
MSHAHNDYLQLLAEGGLLVSIPVMAVAGVFALTVLRAVRGSDYDDSEGYWVRVGSSVGLLAIAVQETAEFSLHIPANMFLFATAAAIALSPRSDSPSSSLQ